ncbi:hypothetical protein KSF78_0004878 [Schistosoma japonicum]|nr:hypothetical protein KSF78_0004878 [Schistosoma japonicum]
MHIVRVNLNITFAVPKFVALSLIMRNRTSLTFILFVGPTIEATLGTTKSRVLSFHNACGNQNWTLDKLERNSGCWWVHVYTKLSICRDVSDSDKSCGFVYLEIYTYEFVDLSYDENQEKLNRAQVSRVEASIFLQKIDINFCQNTDPTQLTTRFKSEVISVGLQLDVFLGLALKREIKHVDRRENNWHRFRLLAVIVCIGRNYLHKKDGKV